MLPMRFFQNRAFALANLASLLMFFGMFGSIFLLAQFFQTVQGYSPFGSGLRILPWTLMPMFVAPIAGALSDRIGGARLMGTGLVLQAIGLSWIAAVTSPTVAVRRARRRRSSSRASAWRCSGRRSRTSSSARSPVEEGKASGRRTRSASSAACSAWRCSPRCGRTTAATRAASRSSTGWSRRCGSARPSSPRGAVAAFLMPKRGPARGGRAARAGVRRGVAVASDVSFWTWPGSDPGHVHVRTSPQPRTRRRPAGRVRAPRPLPPRRPALELGVIGPPEVAIELLHVRRSRLRERPSRLTVVASADDARSRSVRRRDPPSCRGSRS